MRYCCSIDLDWIISDGGSRLLSQHTLPRLPPVEWVYRATVLKAKGFEVMPTCTNHDRTGFCLGHAEENEKA